MVEEVTEAGKLLVRETPLSILMGLAEGVVGVVGAVGVADGGGGVDGDPGRLRTREERDGEEGVVVIPASTELELRLFVCLFVRSGTEEEGVREENEEEGEAMSPPR